MLLWSSSKPSIWGVALSWKKIPQGSGVSLDVTFVYWCSTSSSAFSSICKYDSSLLVWGSSIIEQKEIFFLIGF